MALLAEQLVDEWLNRQGFFTLRGIRQGVSEIDLLAIRRTSTGLEAWHVEVQVSFRPVSYISRLSPSNQAELGAKSKTSAKLRPEHVLKSDIADWVKNKFTSSAKTKMRAKCWGDLSWRQVFVHGNVRERRELELIASHGVELIAFSHVLDRLCQHTAGEISSGAGTDIAEIVRYFATRPDLEPHHPVVGDWV